MVKLKATVAPVSLDVEAPPMIGGRSYARPRTGHGAGATAPSAKPAAASSGGGGGSGAASGRHGGGFVGALVHQRKAKQEHEGSAADSELGSLRVDAVGSGVGAGAGLEGGADAVGVPVGARMDAARPQRVIKSKRKKSSLLVQGGADDFSEPSSFVVAGVRAHL